MKEKSVFRSSYDGSYHRYVSSNSAGIVFAFRTAPWQVNPRDHLYSVLYMHFFRFIKKELSCIF